MPAACQLVLPFLRSHIVLPACRSNVAVFCGIACLECLLSSLAALLTAGTCSIWNLRAADKPWHGREARHGIPREPSVITAM